MSERTASEDRVREIDHLEYDEWREHLEEGVLLGLECRSCGHITATPKRACIECGNRELATVELPVTGEVHSETTINVPPEGLDGPYQVAIVELGSARLLGRIEGEIEIGDTVEFAGTTVAEGLPAPLFESRD